MIETKGLHSDIGIVAYDPNPEILVDLVKHASAEARKVWVFQNSKLSPELKVRLRAACISEIEFLNDGTNVGLGIAYNTMATAALLNKADALLLFDQDSSPPTGMLTRLGADMQELIRQGKKPALVGPLPVSVDDNMFKPPRRYNLAGGIVNGTLLPAEFAISSGSLVNLHAFAKLGVFREDFFIDAIDIEWCFRAWHKGYSCWMDKHAVMPHRLGQGIIRIPVVGMLLARQNPARLYTYVRNQVAMIREDVAPLRWKVKLLPYLALQGLVYLLAYRGERMRVMKAFCWGFSDGLANRMGPGRRSAV